MIPRGFVGVEDQLWLWMVAMIRPGAAFLAALDRVHRRVGEARGVEHHLLDGDLADRAADEQDRADRE